MARPLRIEYEGAVYHITSRGNERRQIFLDEKDRLIFFSVLKEVKRKYNFIFHAYCFMENHYHLIIETPEGNLSKGMRQLNGMYTQLFNRKHDRVGHLFQGRYKAILIEKDNHLLEACRYVVLNPVRAGIVTLPGQWQWSSYNATTGKQQAQEFFTPDWILVQFDTNRSLAQKRYQDFVSEGIDKEPIYLRMKTRNILGGDEFIQRLKELIVSKEQIEEIPKNQRYVNRPELNELFREQQQAKESRNNKIKVALETYGYTQKELAAYLNLHYSTISKLVRRSQHTATS